jgi:hypothetical protein
MNIAILLEKGSVCFSLYGFLNRYLHKTRKNIRGFLVIVGDKIGDEFCHLSISLKI